MTQSGQSLNLKMNDLGLFASVKSRVQRERLDTNDDFAEFRGCSASAATQKPLKGRIGEFIQEVEPGACRVKYTDPRAWQRAGSFPPVQVDRDAFKEALEWWGRR